MKTVMHAFLGVLGFSSGFLVAGGVVALMIGLGIVTRFIGITHTAKRIGVYENAILAGAIVGNIMTVFHTGTNGALPMLLNSAILIVAGLFMGAFVGGWIMALAEVINVFPVFCRKFGIVKGLSWIVISLALGKTLGSMLHLYLRWGHAAG